MCAGIEEMARFEVAMARCCVRVRGIERRVRWNNRSQSFCIECGLKASKRGLYFWIRGFRSVTAIDFDG